MSTKKDQAAATGVAEIPAKKSSRSRPKVSAKAVSDKKEKSRTIDGIRLIKRIKKTLIEQDRADRYIADMLGVTTIYWQLITNGHRSIKALNKDKFERIAEFLELPVIQVYLLADFFGPQDFFVDKSLDEQLWLVIEKMQHDKQWAAYAPTRQEWDLMPLKVRIGYTTLYERDFGRALTEKAKVEVPDLTR